MNPLEKRVQDLERIVNELINVNNVPFIENIRRRSLQEAIKAGTVDNASSADINQSVNGTDPFTSPKAYNKKVRVDVDGTAYYIGLHNI